MISPGTTPPTPSRSLPINPHTLSLMSSPTIFSQVLALRQASTLATCLRVSHSISHMAASILYRDVSLAHILPPVISPPAPVPDTRSPFLGYVRTLRLPWHLLYDPAICTPMIKAMPRLRTVVLPADWPGWILCPNIHQPIFAPAPADAPRKLKVVVTGLKSPAAQINHGLLQSDLLAQADEVVLSIDSLNPVFRGPRQRVTAAMGGPRYSSDLPEGVKKLVLLLPKDPDVKDWRPRMAGFDMGADSGFFHTPHGSGLEGMRAHGLEPAGYAGPDVAPDLASVLARRKTGCKVVIVVDAPGEGAGGDAAEGRWRVRVGEDAAQEVKVGAKLKKLKERTELLVEGLLGRQGLEDATAARAEDTVRWVSASEWEGMEGVQDILDKRGRTDSSNRDAERNVLHLS